MYVCDCVKTIVRVEFHARFVVAIHVRVLHIFTGLLDPVSLDVRPAELRAAIGVGRTPRARYHMARLRLLRH